MAASIGVVTQIQGRFILIDAQGREHELKMGDKIHKGERILSQGGSQMAVTLENSEILHFDEKADLMLDLSVLGKELFAKEDVSVEGAALGELLEEDAAIDADAVEETAAGSEQTAYIAGGDFVDRNGGTGSSQAGTSSLSLATADEEKETDIFIYETGVGRPGSTGDSTLTSSESEPASTAALDVANRSTSLYLTAAQEAVAQVQAANSNTSSSLNSASMAASNINIDELGTLQAAEDAARSSSAQAAAAVVQADKALSAALAAVEEAEKALLLAQESGGVIGVETEALETAQALLLVAEAEKALADQALIDAAAKAEEIAQAIDKVIQEEAESDALVAVANETVAGDLNSAQSALEAAGIAAEKAAEASSRGVLLSEIDLNDPLSLQNAEDLSQAALEAETSAYEAAEQALSLAQTALASAEAALGLAEANNEDTTDELASLSAAQALLEEASVLYGSVQSALDDALSRDVAIEELIVNTQLQLLNDSGENSSDNITSGNRPSYSGKAEIGSSVTLVFTDAFGNELTSQAPLDEQGVWSYTASETLADGEYQVSVVVRDEAGNSSITKSQLTIDTQAPASPQSTDIAFEDGEMIMRGGGTESGNIVKLYDESGSVVATTVVDAQDGWRLQIGDLTNTPINDNEFFKVTETDPAGNESILSEATHYINYDWSRAETEAGDDFVFAGGGDDYLAVNDNDLNDVLVFDGGAGSDTVSFSGTRAEYEITTLSTADGKSYTLVRETAASDSDNNGIGDINELRSVETIKFSDGNYDTASDTFYHLQTQTKIESVTVEGSIDTAAMLNQGYTLLDGVWMTTVKENLSGTGELFKGFFDGMVGDMGHMRKEGSSGIIPLGREVSGMEMAIRSFDSDKDNASIVLYKEGEAVLSIAIAEIYDAQDNAQTTLFIEGSAWDISGFDAYEIVTEGRHEFKVGEPTVTVSYPVDEADLIMQSKNIEVDFDIVSSTDAIIDFDNLSRLVHDVEVIDLRGQGDQLMTNLSAQDVLDITDADNALFILGDGGDRVELDTHSEWSATGETIGDGSGRSYDIYQGSFGEQRVTLKIDTNIQLDEI